MLQLFRKRTLPKLISTQITGSTLGTEDYKKDPKIFGEVNEVNLKLNGINKNALLDTGSCVSILS